MEKTFKINLLVVGLAILLVFSLGFMAKNGVVSRKEIRALHSQIAGENRLISKMRDTIDMKSDTINTLKTVVHSNSAKIRTLRGEIAELDFKIASYKVSLPPNETYNNLQNIRPDTLPKEWPFSTPQINGLYEDEYELSRVKMQIPKYESITGMLTYNIRLLEKTDSLRVGQLSTCLNTTKEYKKMMTLKDEEIKQWKKRGRGRMIWGATATGIAAVFLTLLLVK